LEIETNYENSIEIRVHTTRCIFKYCFTCRL